MSVTSWTPGRFRKSCYVTQAGHENLLFLHVHKSFFSDTARWYGHHCDWGIACRKPVGFQLKIGDFWQILWPNATITTACKCLLEINFVLALMPWVPGWVVNREWAQVWIWQLDLVMFWSYFGFNLVLDTCISQGLLDLFWIQIGSNLVVALIRIWIGEGSPFSNSRNGTTTNRK